MKRDGAWSFVCPLEDIRPESGVRALLDGWQIAVFRVGEEIFALDNRDPASSAHVLSRGIVGDVMGEPVVASPVYQQRFGLSTGRCLENPELSVRTYPAQVANGDVWVRGAARVQSVRGLHKRRLVVVGSGMAGMRTVEELLAIAPDAEIVVFDGEPHSGYNRTLLSPLLAGEKHVNDIILHDDRWYAENGVTLDAGDTVTRIDRWRRVVVSKRGLVVPYERLLLATGSTPVVLDVPGNDLPGAMTFRDLRDVDAMLTAARSSGAAIVIGGGLLGLEAANGLQRQGMNVTVVHRCDTLMERHLDQDAAAMLRRSLEERGVRFRMPAQTTAILGDTRVSGVRFDDGSELAADLVVTAVGIRPNIEPAKRAGLRCERGVVVDDTMQTFDPSVYAVGECVQHRNTTFGRVAPLWDQARVCAAHLAEIGHSRFRAAMVPTRLRVTGVDLFSAGDFVGSARSEALVLKDPKRGVYKRLVIEDNRLRGAVLFGDTKDGAWYVDLMGSGDDIGPLRDRLLVGHHPANGSSRSPRPIDRSTAPTPRP